MFLCKYNLKKNTVACQNKNLKMWKKHERIKQNVYATSALCNSIQYEILKIDKLECIFKTVYCHLEASESVSKVVS